jgi:hypothetical protein
VAKISKKRYLFLYKHITSLAQGMKISNTIAYISEQGNLFLNGRNTHSLSTCKFERSDFNKSPITNQKSSIKPAP